MVREIFLLFFDVLFQVQSAMMNEINLKLLGWGEKWQGLSQKLEGALNYISNSMKEVL